MGRLAQFSSQHPGFIKFWRGVYLAIPVAALAAAFYTEWRATKTALVIDNSLHSLQQIQGELTTSYVGKFPDNLPAVVEALQKANATILVACDLPGYGIYSKHDVFEDYRAEIMKRATRITVKMVVLDKTKREELTDLQFKDVKIEELKHQKEFESFLRWSNRKREQISTLQDFKRALMEEHDRTLKQDFRSVDRREYSGTMPLYIWISDDKLALFSIPSLTGGGHEGVFITRDRDIIDQLTVVFNSYYSKGSPVSD
jgi:hypothetical protein